MLAFYVYDNHHRNRARVHRADCRYCNFGLGKGERTSGAYDRWMGFDSREAAFAAVADLNRRDMLACGTCTP